MEHSPRKNSSFPVKILRTAGVISQRTRTTRWRWSGAVVIVAGWLWLASCLLCFVTVDVVPRPKWKVRGEGPWGLVLSKPEMTVDVRCTGCPYAMMWPPYGVQMPFYAFCDHHVVTTFHPVHSAAYEK